jgi:hypothetical protein
MECNRHEPIQLQFYRLRQSISQNIGRKIRGVPLAVTVGRLHSRHHIQDTSHVCKVSCLVFNPTNKSVKIFSKIISC